MSCILLLICVDDNFQENVELDGLNHYKILLTRIDKLELIITEVTREQDMYKKKFEILKNENENLVSSLKKSFNDDQIVALKRKSSRFLKWSDATAERAISLRFSWSIWI